MKSAGPIGYLAMSRKKHVWKDMHDLIKSDLCESNGSLIKKSTQRSGLVYLWASKPLRQWWRQCTGNGISVVSVSVHVERSREKEEWLTRSDSLDGHKILNLSLPLLWCILYNKTMLPRFSGQFYLSHYCCTILTGMNPNPNRIIGEPAQD